VRRDNSQKLTVKDEEIVDQVRRFLQEIQRDLFAKAKKSLVESIQQVSNYDDFKKALAGGAGFIRACWCGMTDCEETIQNDTGATIRTLPLKEEQTFSACVRCGKPAAKVAYFARSY
jgi:prolyl-tRNA synthetase